MFFKWGAKQQPLTICRKVGKWWLSTGKSHFSKKEDQMATNHFLKTGCRVLLLQHEGSLSRFLVFSRLDQFTHKNFFLLLSCLVQTKSHKTIPYFISNIKCTNGDDSKKELPNRIVVGRVYPNPKIFPNPLKPEKFKIPKPELDETKNFEKFETWSKKMLKNCNNKGFFSSKPIKPENQTQTQRIFTKPLNLNPKKFEKWQTD